MSYVHRRKKLCANSTTQDCERIAKLNFKCEVKRSHVKSLKSSVAQPVSVHMRRALRARAARCQIAGKLPISTKSARKRPKHSPFIAQKSVGILAACSRKVLLGPRPGEPLPVMAHFARFDARFIILAPAYKTSPPTCYGVPTLELFAAVFLYTVEKPYPLYSCIAVPLNVSGKRTLQLLQQQLPCMKLFTLGLRCLPPGAAYHYKGALYRGVDIDRSAAFKAKYEAHSSAHQVGHRRHLCRPLSA